MHIPRSWLLGFAAAACASLLLPAMRADAQVQRSGGGSAQQQQLAAGLAAMQAENAQLKLKADELQKKLDAATHQQSESQGKLGRLQQEAARTAEAQKASAAAADKLQAQLTELIGRFREMAQTLKNTEGDRAAQHARAESAERDLAVCVDHNAQMYLLASQFMDRVEHRGFWSRATDKEPFTRLSRIRLDNLADDYHQRIDELRLKNGAAAAPAGNRPAAPHEQPRQ